MGKLAQRFLDPAKSGVYRVTGAAVPQTAAREAGLALLEVRLEGRPDKEGLLRQVAASLAFPDWFGGNWDALEDCLTDLSWHAAPGYVLLIHGAGAFAARHPDDHGVLVDVLGACAEYWRERGVPFFAVCADPGAALALPPLYREARVSTFKIPVSVLVVVHTRALEVLLLERASRPGFWQSVTGSIDRDDEPLETTALREVREETGIDADAFPLLRWNVVNTFDIYPQWRDRYGPGVTRNTEHVFSLEVPGRLAVKVAPGEHLAYVWLPWREAAQKCFSWSNRDAILALVERTRPPAA